MIPPSHASNIAMGQWRFVSIAGSAVRAVGNKQPYLKFDGSKNIVTGYSGCNRLRGTYIADESTVTFQHVATTRAACLGDSDERQVLDVLSSATGYKIVDHELHLLGASGTLAILTRPHEEQTTKSKPAEK
jgi:heat shock protein HslJ